MIIVSLLKANENVAPKSEVCSSDIGIETSTGYLITSKDFPKFSNEKFDCKRNFTTIGGVEVMVYLVTSNLPESIFSVLPGIIGNKK